MYFKCMDICQMFGIRQDSINNYDRILHESLVKLFREQCLSSSGQIKEFLRGLPHDTDQNSVIKSILDEEPILSHRFSKVELRKLSLLWISVLAGYNNSAELLVRSGADVNECIGPHDPPIVLETMSILHTLLSMHPSPENERLIRLVTDHGADLQARDSMGHTLLFTAVQRGRVQMIEMLLVKGADVNIADNWDTTPLLLAASEKKANELLPLLMKYGADFSAKDSRRCNVLHYLSSASVEYTDLARVLIEKGASVDDEDEERYQPIHLAALHGKNGLVKLFLDHGADVNAQTEYGSTPLHCATMSLKRAVNEVVETLFERNANIHLREMNGQSALHNASKYMPMRRQGENVINLLMSAGADVVTEDCNGKTPFALSLNDQNREDFMHEPVESQTKLIKMLALKKVCQPWIELKDEKIIERHPNMWRYYRECIQEIDRMKFTKFIESCTFLDLLTKSYCQITALMRNLNFETKFKQYDLSGFSKYAEDILRAFERAQNHIQRRLEQEDVINEAVYNILPHLVVDEILHYIFNCCKNVKSHC